MSDPGSCRQKKIAKSTLLNLLFVFFYRITVHVWHLQLKEALCEMVQISLFGHCICACNGSYGLQSCQESSLGLSFFFKQSQTSLGFSPCVGSLVHQINQTHISIAYSSS